MTLEQLIKKYKNLASQEAAIPSKIKELVNKTKPLSKDISKLQRRINDINIEISGKPARVDKKVCNCAFLCMGSHCEHYPAPNPDVAREMGQRNALVAKANKKQTQIENYFNDISKLANKRIELKKQQIDIRNKMIDKREKVLAQPLNILELLGLRKKPLMPEEEIRKERHAKKVPFFQQKIVKYSMYAIGGYILYKDILRLKEKK